jgi:hypothetical protein
MRALDMEAQIGEDGKDDVSCVCRNAAIVRERPLFGMARLIPASILKEIPALAPAHDKPKDARKAVP